MGFSIFSVCVKPSRLPSRVARSFVDLHYDNAIHDNEIIYCGYRVSLHVNKALLFEDIVSLFIARSLLDLRERRGVVVLRGHSQRAARHRRPRRGRRRLVLAGRARGRSCCYCRARRRGRPASPRTSSGTQGTAVVLVSHGELSANVDGNGNYDLGPGLLPAIGASVVDVSDGVVASQVRALDVGRGSSDGSRSGGYSRLDSLPLGAAILEPYLDLDFAESERVGDLRPLGQAQVLLRVKLLFQLQKLLASESRSTPASFGGSGNIRTSSVHPVQIVAFAAAEGSIGSLPIALAVAALVADPAAAAIDFKIATVFFVYEVWT